jgi:hypothetical protein
MRTDSASFERDVLRALWAGAAAGCMMALLTGVAYRSFLPLWPLLGPGVLAAFALAPGRGRTWLAVAALCAPVAGFTSAGAGAAALCGAVTGGALVLARLERAGGDRPALHGLRVTGGLCLGAVLGVVAEAAAGVFMLRLEDLGVPLLAAGALTGAAAALFLSLAALPALLEPAGDALATRARALLPELKHPRLVALARRALEANRRCGQLVLALPADPSRAELVKALEALLSGTLNQAERLRALLGGDAQGQAAAEAEVTRLEAELAASCDAVAGQHLALALEVAREDHARLRGAEVERARLWARLEAEVALLSRARASLEEVRGGHEAVRAAELTALCRRLAALSRTQALEADVLTEVGVGAELDQLAGAQALRQAS